MVIKKIYQIIFKLKYKVGFKLPWNCYPGNNWFNHYCFFGQSIPRCDCCEPRGKVLFYRKWGFEIEIEYPIIGMTT